MATLQAVVDIQDRASAKFAAITGSAKAFEEQLERVDNRLREIQIKLAALSKMTLNIRVALDTSSFDSQLAMLMARAKGAGAIDTNIGGGAGLGGFAMAASGLILPNIGAVISGDGDPEAGIRGVDKSKRRRVGIERADNGVLGFATTMFRVLMNLQTILGPLTDGFVKLFSFMTQSVGRVFELFGKNGAQVVGTLTSMVPAAASAAAGIAAFGAASFVVVMIGTALASILGLIAAALTSLLVPLAAVTTGLAAIGGVIGFVALPMIKWISNTKKLVDEKDELNKKVQTLDKSSKEYLRTQQRLDEIQKELNKSGAEGVFRQLQQAGEKVSSAVFTKENNQLFTNIIGSGLEALKPMLPILTKMVNLFAGAVSRVAKNFVAFTKDPDNLALIYNFFEAGSRLVEPMANALGLIGKIFMQIGVAAGPIAERMLADFVGWLDRISESLSNPEGIKGLMGFFQEMYPIFKALIGLVADFGGGIVDVGRQNAPELLNFIKWLGEFGAVFVKWINETVDKYGPMLARWFKIIGNLIGILWDAATKIYDALEPVIDFLTRLIELAIAAWRAFTRFLEVTHILDLIKVALAVIMWPLNLMLEILTQVFRWVESLFTKLADSKYGRAATEVWGQIAGAISNVAGVVQTVIDALKTAWEWMQKLNPGSWFGGQDELTVDAVNSNPTALMAARNGQVPPNMRYDPTTNRVVAAGASGAIVTRPTKALIGESGPEAVVPLSAARGARRLRLDSEGGGKSIQIGAVHVHGVQNLDQFVNEVQKYVANLPRESGSQMSIG